MFCPKCGENLPDGSRFCGACGANLSELIPAAAPGQGQPDAAPGAVSNAAPDTGANVPDGASNGAPEGTFGGAVNGAPNVGSYGAPNTGFNGAPNTAFGGGANVPPVTPVQPEFVPPKKKPDMKKIIAAVAAVAVLLILVIGVRALLSGGGSKDNAYVYLENGRYELLTNIKKGESIEIASSKSENVMDSLLAFSPDGKYIYYYTKYDEYSETGSLCRAEYGKLKNNSSKNDKYIEVIATNVQLGFQFLSDNSVLYENGDYTLYHYDGKETTQIAKNVNNYYADDKGRVAYVTGDYSEGYTLYGVSLGDIDNKVKLASNFSYLCNAEDLDNILYIKEEDDYSDTLYSVGFEKDSEKLGENVFVLTSGGERTYFAAYNGTELNLYDFVVDDYAAEDAGITEPDMEDFVVPSYSYDMVTGRNLSESSYDELYTSCTRSLYWYGESTWWSYSMEDAQYQNWGSNTDAIWSATEKFLEKFADSADENGYILVTDEVKSALKAINQAAGGEDWEWLWLCFTRRQSGNTYDYDAYDEAYYNYYNAKDRIEMREVLQDRENAFHASTLYCFENGKLTAVDENVLNYNTYSGGIVFNKPELVTKTVRLEDVSSIYDVMELFYIDYEAENYILPLSGTTVGQMSAGAADTLYEAGENGYFNLYFTDKAVYMSEESGALSEAPVSGGVVGDFSIITDDAEILNVDDSTLYYASGVYVNNDCSYCDLYSYTNGKSTRLARDIMLDTISLYEDGVLMVYTGYRNYYGYELTMIASDGTAKIIGDNVTQYVRVDKSTLLYISDGDLYSYNGKEKKMVETDVDWLWTLHSMKVEQQLGMYDYCYY